MKSSSYVTKRQSINLLAQLLLERTNYSLMTQYVESADNLKLCMNLLKDDRRMINYEGFHIFKVFVANPSKSPAVMRILINNREKLLRFLPTFLEDRKDDVQFEDEKAYLVRMIQQLTSVPPQAAQQQQSQLA
jgi:calcium binding protein 39